MDLSIYGWAFMLFSISWYYNSASVNMLRHIFVPLPGNKNRNSWVLGLESAEAEPETRIRVWVIY